MKTVSNWTLLLSLVLLASCGDTTGSGAQSGSASAAQLDGDATSASLAMKLVSSAGANNGKLNLKMEDDGSFSLENAPINIDSAKATLRRIEFKREGATCEEIEFVPQPGVKCENDFDSSDDSGVEAEIKVQGPFTIDLISGDLSPSLNDLSIPSGNYEVELEFDEEGSSGEYSVEATGTYFDGADSYDFLMQLDINEDVEFENVGFQIVEDSPNDIVFAIDVEKLFLGIDVASCFANGDLTLSSGNVLIIDETSGDGECEDIEDVIEDNLEQDAFSLTINGVTVKSGDDSSDDDSSDDNSNDDSDDD